VEVAQTEEVALTPQQRLQPAVAALFLLAGVTIRLAPSPWLFVVVVRVQVVVVADLLLVPPVSHTEEVLVQALLLLLSLLRPVVQTEVAVVVALSPARVVLAAAAWLLSVIGHKTHLPFGFTILRVLKLT
jgi:hypothetical protein